MAEPSASAWIFHFLIFPFTFFLFESFFLLPSDFSKTAGDELIGVTISEV
jgi:hypothetical protein